MGTQTTKAQSLPPTSSSLSVSTSSSSPPSPSAAPIWSVYVLFCCFGISSWITVNSTFAELPIFANTLPEGWAIGTYLGLMIQAANVFPLLCLYLLKNCGGARRGSGSHPPRTSLDVMLIYVLLVLGAAVALLVGVFWDSTSWIGGSEVSLGLLLLAWLGGGADCSSSVLYWPFAAKYRIPYTSAMATGQGLSSLLAGLLTLAQDPADAMRFSVLTFFLIIFGLMVTTLLAFIALNQWPTARKELRANRRSSATGRLLGSGRADATYDEDSAGDIEQTLLRSDDQDADGYESRADDDDDEDGDHHHGGVIRRASATYQHDDTASKEGDATDDNDDILIPIDLESVCNFSLHDRLLLSLLALLSLVQNGILISLTTYATLPYPDGTRALQWHIILSNVGAPLSAFLSHWIPCRRPFVLAVCWLSLATYITVIAAMSPHPPLLEVTGAVWHVVAVLLVLVCLLSYSKAMLFISLQEGRTDPAKRMFATRWGGICLQIGSLFGSLALFVLIEFGHVFSE